MKNDLGLMIPGPCPLDSSVLLEMARPMRAHYGPDWAAVYHETRYLLKQVIGTSQDLFLTVGSGHLAVETMIGNLLSPGETAVVVDNGHFACRAAEIASLYGVDLINLEIPWGQTADPQALDQLLRKQKPRQVKAVILVHNESSTGVTNSIEGISKVAHDYDALLLVDAVSSIGCMEFQMDRWQVDICAFAPQKGLEAPPGLCMVAVSSRAWEVMAKREKPFVGWYMNLQIWRKYLEEFHDTQPYGITMAVNNVLALRQSLRNILKEGLTERYIRHNKVAGFFRQELRRMGLTVGAQQEEYSSPSITAILGSSRFPPGEALTFLKEKYGIIVTGGLRDWTGRAVRIGHMGIGASVAAVLPVLLAIEHFLHCKGVKFTTGFDLTGVRSSLDT